MAAIEAFLGLMAFAVATGTLYGRFSRPKARIKYSPNVIIAPFKGKTAMQIILANEMNTVYMEMVAKVNISWLEDEGDALPAGRQGKSVRRFQQVKLEIDKIMMFPTSWTINHPIDEESALFGKTQNDLQKMDIEIFVLLKGFDDTFSQTIYSRQSYTSEQFVWGAKFKRPFGLNPAGKLEMDLTKVGEYDKADIVHLVS